MSDTPVLTVSEAARLLRIGRRQAYERVRDGTIPAIRIGGSWRISRRKLMEMIEPAEILDKGCADD